MSIELVKEVNGICGVSLAKTPRPPVAFVLKHPDGSVKRYSIQWERAFRCSVPFTQFSPPVQEPITHEGREVVTDQVSGQFVEQGLALTNKVTDRWVLVTYQLDQNGTIFEQNYVLFPSAHATIVYNGNAKFKGILLATCDEDRITVAEIHQVLG